MARYTEQEKEQLRSIPIVEIMRHLGKNTEHTRSGMYYSPFREERTPSFSIKESTNEWYDFGASEGGGIVAFVCKIAGCRPDEAYDWLANYRNLIPESTYTPLPKVLKEKENRIIVDSASSTFRRDALLEYGMERKVPREILERYCHEVNYHISNNPDRKYFAIGFRNNQGGYILRSPVVKLCTSSAVTTLRPDGKMCESPTSQKAYVFEGFFDFLSYLAYSGLTEPKHDCCILNSVANLKDALEWIGAHKIVAAFTDNDNAGREALDRIVEQVSKNFPDGTVYDMAAKYRDVNDINDKIVNE